MDRVGSQSGVLRLVHPDRGADATPSRRGDDARRTLRAGSPVRKGVDAISADNVLRVPTRRVEQENRSAATLSANDARWILARRAAEAIEGGRAAILRPEVRASLVATGERLGLRTFDANLILAIVQDDARAGWSHANGPSCALPAAVVSRIGLVRPPSQEPTSERQQIAMRLLLAFAAGAAITVAVIQWIQH